MKKYFLLFILTLTFAFSQAQKKVSIGILTDKSSEQTKPLLEQLKSEITAVVGQETTIIFKEVLENNFNKETAKSNYQAHINNNTDIILSFGVINNIMLYQEKEYPKPTIVFGSVNSDFINLPKNQKTSNINNITYLIAPFSYTSDLDVFKSLYNYKKVGIIVDDFLPKALPLKSIFDTYFSKNESDYKLIPISKGADISNSLNDVDAVYLTTGLHLGESELKTLITTINQKKLSSFSAFGKRDVENGILATNQPDTNIDQFFRRIALNVEAIVSGTNASQLPLFIDYKNKLTINHNTAVQIDYPLRYSLLAVADFIGGTNEVKSEYSLSIIDIMNDVVGKNLSLKAEKKNIDLSSQDVKIAKSSYLPDAKASVDGIYIDPKVAEISGGQNPEFSTSGNVVLNQLIYSESASANIDIQNELNKAQKETYNSAELDALLNASVSYFNALILKTNASIQNQNLQVTKRNLELAEQNFEAGASGKSDVLRFRSQLAQNTQSLIEAGNQLRQSFNVINQLMNTSISKKIDIEDAELSEGVFKNYKYEDLLSLFDNPKLQPILIDFLVEEAKSNAPELKNLAFNLNAIKRNYKLNDTGRFIPTVALQGQYNLAISESGKGSTLPVGSPTIPDGTYNVGLNISLPIFQQNQRNINRQTAKIQEDQLSIQKENTELNIEKNINDIILDIVNQIANIEISKVAEETAKESLELTQNAYKNGAVPVIQLIDAQTNYLQSQLASTTANYNYLIASMQLERAIGYFFLMHSEIENQDFIQRANQFILNKN
ncbi:TolC family protein [Tenacibaculum retecalamus]|uniref:TolC family protein n=1 Tax=Tenacibaculum retecalamus TaxID=3018315 RepID=UPI0023D8ED7D|nr:TolC family protein [Tenacibaculum retecalamus]WBX70387.1 TolC family protein [Tenacibaculum retecalamus]